MSEIIESKKPKKVLFYGQYDEAKKDKWNERNEIRKEISELTDEAKEKVVALIDEFASGESEKKTALKYWPTGTFELGARKARVILYQVTPEIFVVIGAYYKNIDKKADKNLPKPKSTDRIDSINEDRQDILDFVSRGEKYK